MEDGTPLGSICDVAGVEVGHHHRAGRGWQTGTTVVVLRGGAVPGVSVRGGGPGTRETDALAPTTLVGSVHAVCLTGGSAYGLAAADGVVAWLESLGLGFPVGPEPGQVVPVVPAAVIFDLGRGGAFGNRPSAGFGERAARAARRRQLAWGAVGAGTGARAGGLQGGTGTASSVVAVPDASGRPPVDVVVGAIAVVNAHGSVVDPSTGLPWQPDGLGLRRPVAAERRSLLDALAAPVPVRLNTTIGVVATSAQLTKAEATRVADVAHDGLARAIRPAHGATDGDTVFAVATGRHELPAGVERLGAAGSRHASLAPILAAAADTFAAACTHAVVAATRVGDVPAYRELCPSAWSHR